VAVATDGDMIAGKEMSNGEVKSNTTMRIKTETMK
jgi:hypothetical protein